MSVSRNSQSALLHSMGHVLRESAGEILVYLATKAVISFERDVAEGKGGVELVGKGAMVRDDVVIDDVAGSVVAGGVVAGSVGGWVLSAEESSQVVSLKATSSRGELWSVCRRRGCY